MRVEVGPTAEKRFTMLFVELMRVLFQKRCKIGVRASIFIILLFVLVVAEVMVFIILLFVLVVAEVMDKEKHARKQWDFYGVLNDWIFGGVLNDGFFLVI